MRSSSITLIAILASLISIGLCEQDREETKLDEKATSKVLADLTESFIKWEKETGHDQSEGITPEEKYFGENIESLVHLLVGDSLKNLSIQGFLSTLNDLLLKPCEELLKKSDERDEAKRVTDNSPNWSQTTKLCKVIKDRYRTVSEFVCRQLGHDEQECSSQADLMYSLNMLRDQLGKIASSVDLISGLGMKKLLDEHLGPQPKEEL